MGKWGKAVSPGKELIEVVDPSERVGRQLRNNVKKGMWVVT